MRGSSASSAKRVQVTFTREQWELIERLRGVMGTTDAEVVRNIVLAWLSEKSMVSSAVRAGEQGSKGVQSGRA